MVRDYHDPKVGALKLWRIFVSMSDRWGWDGWTKDDGMLAISLGFTGCLGTYRGCS